MPRAVAAGAAVGASVSLRSQFCISEINGPSRRQVTLRAAVALRAGAKGYCRRPPAPPQAAQGQRREASRSLCCRSCRQCTAARPLPAASCAQPCAQCAGRRGHRRIWCTLTRRLGARRQQRRGGRAANFAAPFALASRQPDASVAALPSLRGRSRVSVSLAFRCRVCRSRVRAPCGRARGPAPAFGTPHTPQQANAPRGVRRVAAPRRRQVRRSRGGWPVPPPPAARRARRAAAGAVRRVGGRPSASSRICSCGGRGRGEGRQSERCAFAWFRCPGKSLRAM